ncbi:iron (metal) dependent repressor, DtxR family [Balnearium lithotrophicum]|uniref:Transcriptional regulator MntR n=1 Tax=Balnearium lithotrophicum TaxID=223788 RepID=A0A521B002_9BACT|nr:metal-dependent transcriptional regulator [Balnearium lithotrophicum]SMO40365.1 iron (metal) dependent repressor, DtxR family [Balnearium lithotrophicum]
MEDKLAPRLEDYLETIYLIERENGVARVKEIAKARSVKMPTVTEVLKRLSERGFIKYEPYGYVRTTKKGKEYAEALYRKHEVLREFLMDVLGLSKERAEEEGCLMEHHLSKDTIRRIQKLTETLKEKGIRVEGED